MVAHGNRENVPEHHDETRLAEHRDELGKNLVCIGTLEAPHAMPGVPVRNEVLQALEISCIDETRDFHIFVDGLVKSVPHIHAQSLEQ